jgi:hypothetical protein
MTTPADAAAGAGGRKLKKKLKPGLIELDANEPTIVVNYEETTLDMTNLGPDGQPTVLSKVQNSKRIKLKSFGVSSPIGKFANQIIEKCNLIHPSKVPLISSLLEQLQVRIAYETGQQIPAPATTEVAAEVGRMTLSSSPSQAVIPSQQGLIQSQSGSQSQQRHSLSSGGASTAKLLTAQALAQSKAAESNANSIGTNNSNSSSTAPVSSTSQPIVSLHSNSNSNQTSSLSFQDNSSLNSSSSTASASTSAAVGPAYNVAPINIPVSSSVGPVSSPTEASDQTDNGSSKNSSNNGGEKAEKKPKKKETAGKKASASKSDRPGTAKSKAGKEKEKEKKKPEVLEKASMDDIDTYNEMLYEEDMDVKIRGTGMLLQLVQDPVNLDYFIESETLVGALSRVLQEDSKKSTELVTNILEIFFCFSSFTQLHQILLQNKIGYTTMNIINLEIKRYDMKTSEPNADRQKLTQYLQKQEKLMFVCFYILLNLAEDNTIEYKMKQKKVIKQLVGTLKRENEDRSYLDHLHLLTVTFLKKLSIFAENKAEMLEYDLIGKINPFLSVSNETLINATLRLIFNLTFDVETRKQICKTMLSKFVDVLKLPNCRQFSIRVLYNLSTDESIKADIESALVPVAPMLIQMITRCPNKLVDQELIALAINLACVPKIADIMSRDDNVALMIKRVQHTQDTLLLKFLRNLSDHNGTCKEQLTRFVHELTSMVLKSPNIDYMSEALGVLVNINLPKVSFSELLNKYPLYDFIVKNLVPGMAEDDILLQVIMLVGNLAIDAKSAPILSQPRLIRLLNEVLTDVMDKSNDGEILLHILFTLFRFLLHAPTREAICMHESFTDNILDLVGNPNLAIRQHANMCLDIIMETAPVWRSKILRKRFEIYNRQWLEFMKQNGIDDPLAGAGGLTPGRNDTRDEDSKSPIYFNPQNSSMQHMSNSHVWETRGPQFDEDDCQHHDDDDDDDHDDGDQEGGHDDHNASDDDVQ